MDPKAKKEIEEIIALFESSNLSELEVEKEGIRLHLKKETAKGAPLLPVKETFEKAGTKAKEEKSSEDKDLIPIKTPMVGTFYKAPSPDAEPFIEVGDIIQPDQVVCIIEAMKLMNEIKAEIKGRVVKVLVEDGHPVEYGQTLFLIRAEE